jgi:hypothetical protein
MDQNLESKIGFGERKDAWNNRYQVGIQFPIMRL